MQYIQLQGQVAAELELPLNGSYNLFIDTTDNTIKAKDSDGTITGGGNSLTELTKTQLDASIASGSLIPGTFYKITNVATGSSDNTIQEGGTTIILQASTTSSLNPKGVGLFWNPKYYNPQTDLGEYEVWNPTFEFELDRYYNDVSFDMEEQLNLDAPCNITLRPNILDNTAIAVLTDNSQAPFFLDTQENYSILFNGDNTGITGSLTNLLNGPTSFTVGSKVIWGGRVWTNLNGNLGDSIGYFELDNTEWQVVSYNSTDYNLVADIIEYDYTNNNICYRKDVTNNIEVFSNWWEMDGNTNYIKGFPWGHPTIHNVSLENTYSDNLINFPNYNEIDGMYMKSNSRFGANYWGKYNRFYDIVGETDSRISNLSLGKWTTFKRIKMGINSNIGGYDPLYVVGNDGNTITDITMGINSNIYGLDMYQYSYLDNIIMGDNSEIYNMNMHYDTRIQNIDMGLDTSLNSISFGNGSYLNNTNLDASSYISSLNLDVNAEMYNISLGRNSYIEYSSLGTNCSIYDISMGIDSYMNCNTLRNDGGNSSTLNNISLGDNSSVYSVQLYGSTYMQNINALNSCGFGNLTITGSNSYISNFQLDQGSGFGSFTIDGSQSSVGLNLFKIGQDNGFGGSDVTSSMQYVTMDREFNNWEANKSKTGLIASFSPGVSWSDVNSFTYIEPYKSFQILDTTGWDASTSTLNYYLPTGDFDGQTIKFFMTSDGTNINGNASNLHIWMNTFATMDDFSGTIEQQPWYPFSQTNNYTQIRADIPQCIWLNGKWIVDNDAWD